MGRRALEPGENGKITMRGRHPRTGRWTSDARLKAEKVRPKRWRAEVRYHDPSLHKVRVLTAEGDTKGAAEDSLEAALRHTKEREGTDARAGEVTVGRAVKAHIRRMEGGEVQIAKTTSRAYCAVARRHLLSDESMIRDIPLSRLTPLQIEEEMKRMVRAGVGSQLTNWKPVLRAVLDRAKKGKAIKENPMDRVGTVKVPKGDSRVYSNGVKRSKNNALTDDEDRRLHEQIKKERGDIADLLTIMRYQGPRISEGLSLRIADFDRENRLMSIEGKLVRVKGEGVVWEELTKSDLSTRTLPLRQPAFEALERRLRAVQKREGIEYLFTPGKAELPNPEYMQALLRRALDRADLPHITPHALRRTVEKELEIAGATVSEREVFMGHTEDVARKHYADRGAVRRVVITDLDRGGVGADRSGEESQ